MLFIVGKKPILWLSEDGEVKVGYVFFTRKDAQKALKQAIYDGEPEADPDLFHIKEFIL